jgi:hypothetical protein
MGARRRTAPDAGAPGAAFITDMLAERGGQPRGRFLASLGSLGKPNARPRLLVRVRDVETK